MHFQAELRDLINRASKENDNNTPDFILAEYLNGCLDAFTTAVNNRDKWYGRDASENFSSKRKETVKVVVPVEVFLAGYNVGEYLYKRGLDISRRHSAMMVSRFSDDMIYEQEVGV